MKMKSVNQKDFKVFLKEYLDPVRMISLSNDRYQYRDLLSGELIAAEEKERWLISV